MSTNFDILKKLNEETFIVKIDGCIRVIKKIDPMYSSLYDTIEKINNPNLAKLYGKIIVNESPYIVQEYIEGNTIESLVEAGKKFSDDEIRYIAGEICNGLKALHQKGIIHRDISPSNIILGDKVKIIDYGISRKFKANKSRDTQILGTQGFAAPEQFGFSQTDKKADIYSLGVLMNYMSTGELPLNKTVDSPLAKIISICTHIDPNKRYENVSQLQASLKQNKAKRFLSEIIGFRSNSIYKKLIASLYYIIWLLSTCLVMFYDIKSIYTSFENLWLFFWMFLVPIATIFNYKGYVQRLKKDTTKIDSIVIRTLSTLLVEVIAFIPIVISSAIETFYH